MMPSELGAGLNDVERFMGWQGCAQDIAAVQPPWVTEPSEVKTKVKHPFEEVSDPGDVNPV